MMKQFLTAKEAADYLGISESEIEKLTCEGKIPSYKIGGIYTRYRIDDLNVYGRKSSPDTRRKYSVSFADRVKDFFYFNDFYIFALSAIVVILYFIFK